MALASPRRSAATPAGVSKKEKATNTLLTWMEERATSGGTLLLRVEEKYDTLGRRIEEARWTSATGTVTTRFTYQGDNVRADLDGSNALVMRYVRPDGVDALGARINAGGVASWYLTDRQGTVQGNTDASGALSNKNTYDGFGARTSQTNASASDRYLYTGRELQTDSGLQNNRRRWYDTRTGSWTTSDPKGFDAGDNNLYRYVMNGPTNATDPTGLYYIVPGQDKEFAVNTIRKEFGVNAVWGMLDDGRAVIYVSSYDKEKLARAMANTPADSGRYGMLEALRSDSFHREWQGTGFGVANLASEAKNQIRGYAAGWEKIANGVKDRDWKYNYERENGETRLRELQRLEQETPPGSGWQRLLIQFEQQQVATTLGKAQAWEQLSTGEKFSQIQVEMEASAKSEVASGDPTTVEDVLRKIAKDNWTQTTIFVDGFLGPRMAQTEFFSRWPEIANPSIRVDELRERWGELPLMRNMPVSELKHRWRELPFMAGLKTSELRGAYERGELARTAGRSLSDALLWEALQRVLMSTPAPKGTPHPNAAQINKLHAERIRNRTNIGKLQEALENIRGQQPTNAVDALGHDAFQQTRIQNIMNNIAELQARNLEIERQIDILLGPRK